MRLLGSKQLLFLVVLVFGVGFLATPYDSISAAYSSIEQTVDSEPEVSLVQYGYWLNTNSNVRHNSGCRYYKNTKEGRMCSAYEGKSCGICGG